MTTEALSLEALEHALATARRGTGELVHHSDKGSQYVAIAYTERLADYGIKPSVGSVGDSYDNALAEAVNGLYKTELIYSQRTWASLTDARVRYDELGALVEHQPATRAPGTSHPGRV